MQGKKITFRNIIRNDPSELSFILNVFQLYGIRECVQRLFRFEIRGQANHTGWRTGELFTTAGTKIKSRFMKNTCRCVNLICHLISSDSTKKSWYCMKKKKSPKYGRFPITSVDLNSNQFIGLALNGT